MIDAWTYEEIGRGCAFNIKALLPARDGAWFGASFELLSDYSRWKNYQQWQALQCAIDDALDLAWCYDGSNYSI